MDEFYSKVAGVTANNPNGNNRQSYIKAFCKPGMPLILKREPDNKFDNNAVGVWIKARALIFFTNEIQIGYLESDTARSLAGYIDNGGDVKANIAEVTGGKKDKKTFGVNICIQKKREI